MAKKPSVSKVVDRGALFSLYQGIVSAIMSGQYLDAILYYNHFRIFKSSPIKVRTKVNEQVDSQGNPYENELIVDPRFGMAGKPTSTQRDELLTFLKDPSKGFVSPAKEVNKNK